MSTVIVLGTMHSEGGACSSEKLLKIIEKISPEVIFCEAAPEVFPKMIEATEDFNPPEIKIIREILADCSIKIVPVDIHGIVVGDERMDEIFDWIIEKMENYKNAVRIQINETYKEGYNFLNSKKNDKINFDKALMEREIVTKENNRELTLDYVKWVKWNNIRENHWIKLIHENFHENKFNTAVLMVGSAHRVGLQHKIMELDFNRKTPLSWNFYYL
ncbi:hypothetical protein [Flagellimonas sp.]|uniref:hypothetical protein n=1 Tax=Flagellimonas sp. TaxID=2058762 RepID=UPI003AB628C5